MTKQSVSSLEYYFANACNNLIRSVIKVTAGYPYPANISVKGEDTLDQPSVRHVVSGGNSLHHLQSPFVGNYLAYACTDILENMCCLGTTDPNNSFRQVRGPVEHKKRLFKCGYKSLDWSKNSCKPTLPPRWVLISNPRLGATCVYLLMIDRIIETRREGTSPSPTSLSVYCQLSTAYFSLFLKSQLSFLFPVYHFLCTVY